MTTKSRRNSRRSAMVPVTTTEDVPLLDEQERSELMASLREAEAEIKAGKGTDYDPKAFKDRLLRIYRGKQP